MEKSRLRSTSSKKRRQRQCQHGHSRRRMEDILSTPSLISSSSSRKRSSADLLDVRDDTISRQKRTREDLLDIHGVCEHLSNLEISDPDTIDMDIERVYDRTDFHMDHASAPATVVIPTGLPHIPPTFQQLVPCH